MKKIIIKDVYIDNVGKLKDTKINMFEDYTIISGRNKLGKTTIQNAISYAICKRSIDGNGKYDPQPIMTDGTYNEGAIVKIVLNIEINGEPYNLSISRRKRNKDFVWSCEINGIIKSSPNEYYAEVMKLFGFDNTKEGKDLLLACLHINYLISLGDKKARSIIMSLYDVSKREVFEQTKFKNPAGNVVGFTKRYGKLLAVGNSFDVISSQILGKKNEINASIAAKQERLDEQKQNLDDKENSDVKVDLEEIDKNIADLDKQIEDHNETDALHKNESGELAKLERRNEKHSRDIDSKENELTQLKKTITDAQQEYRDIEHRTNKECKNCQDRLLKLSNNTLENQKLLKVEHETIKGLKETHKEYEKEVNDFKVTPAPTTDLVELKVNKFKLEESKKTEAATITSIRNRIAILETDIIELRDDLALEDKFFFEHEAYIKAYCERVESQINKGGDNGFKIKLFKINKGEGTVRAVFTPMTNNIPYILGSTSEQLDAKVNVSEIIQFKCGIEASIMLDCHECKDKKVVSKHQIIASEVDRSQNKIYTRRDL